MESVVLAPFDYVVLSLVALSTFFAFLKGFIKTALSFLSWILAAGVAYFASPYVKDQVAQHTQHDLVVDLGTPIMVYLVALIIISIINTSIISATQSVRGGALDRSLGMAFGFARGCLLSCLIYLLAIFVSLFFNLAPSSDGSRVPGWISESKSYTLLSLSSSYLMGLLPDEMNQAMKDLGKKLNLPSLHSDVFTEQQQSIIYQMIQQLPKGSVPLATLDSFDTFADQLSRMTDEDQLKVSEVILNKYKRAIHYGDVVRGESLSSSEISLLESLLRQKREAGYDKKAREEMEALMDSFQKAR